jgi:DNA-binding MarR family transcriptional regulator
MTTDLPPEMTGQCMVLKTRQAARAVTRRYNLLLRPLGLQTTQASMIFAIRLGGFDSLTELAAKLGIERSALTRNIRTLRDMGLVEANQEGKGRAQRLSLTPAGEEMFATVLPVWVSAQNDLKAELGERTWNVVQNSLDIMGGVG